MRTSSWQSTEVVGGLEWRLGDVASPAPCRQYRGGEEEDEVPLCNLKQYLAGLAPRPSC
jgi:hypothetical protein